MRGRRLQFLFAMIGAWLPLLMVRNASKVTHFNAWATVGVSFVILAAYTILIVRAVYHESRAWVAFALVTYLVFLMVGFFGFVCFVLSGAEPSAFSEPLTASMLSTSR